MTWIEQDEAIGRWLNEHGVENYEQCPIIRRTMLKGGSAASNNEWQEAHVSRLMDFGYDFEDITEIGAGTGQFAKQIVDWGAKCCYLESYRIFDLPHIQKVQEYVCGVESMVLWDDEPKPMKDGLIVSLFALSEMPFRERDDTLIAIGKHNAMFFAFQECHMGTLNWEWFLTLAHELGREFMLVPMPVEGCWYMYIEGGE